MASTQVAPSAAEAEHFSRHNIAVPDVIHAPKGCASCNTSGYAGRVGIFEMTEIDDTLRAAIDSGASEMELTRLGLSEEKTLIGQALLQVAAGKTSLAEALRVVGDGA